MPPSDPINYTYESNSCYERSWLYHIFVSNLLKDSVLEYYVSHEGHNTSDHSTISIHLDIKCTNVPASEGDNMHIPKPMWTRAWTNTKVI